MTIASDIQKLAVGTQVEFYILDATDIGGAIDYFYPGTNELRGPVVWQGQIYQAYPISGEGFEKSGRGTLPRPKVRVANIGGLISAMCRLYKDLVKAKFIRKRTLLKYLDAVNFEGGVNPTADPSQEYPTETWYVNRKIEETKIYVDFELASATDVRGVKLPLRQVIANTCGWLVIGGYRGPYCSYAGPPVATIADTPTSDPELDKCAGRIASCKLRFGANAELPYGGFPGVGRVR